MTQTMKTYTKQDFHNPEQLTRQQVGDEYRLLLPEEVDGRFGVNESNDLQTFAYNSWQGGCYGTFMRCTYRVPLATPLPDGTVLSSNECCWSDEPAQSMIQEEWAEEKAAHAVGKAIEWRPTNTSSWRDDEADVPAWSGYGFQFRIKQEPEKRNLYLAGKMSGEPDFAFPVFYAAAEKLAAQGWRVQNPAELDERAGYPLERLKALTPDEFQVFLKGAMKRDLDALQQCDAIALLPGWENSKGARAEKAVAEWLGLETIYLKGEQPTEPLEEETWEDSRFACGNSPTYAPDDPKGAAGALKAPFHLLPPDALEEVAKVMGEGARKYKAWNFIEANVCASTYIGAMGRHWAAYSKGIDVDVESGLSHLSHLAANCLILLTAQQQGTLRDDRPKLRQI